VIYHRAARRPDTATTAAVDSLQVSFDVWDGSGPRPNQRGPGRRRRTLNGVVALVVAATAVILVHRSESAVAVERADHAVLTMASAYASLGYEPAVQDFVTRLVEISRGALRIEVIDEWGGGARTDAEGEVVDAVRTGKADLGWVGTRVLDTLGVRSFQALTAPMLIDSHAVQRAVIGSDIPDRMLKGLDNLSLTGLGVLAGGLRKPIAVNRPLLEPADWAGITFQTFPSDGQTDALRALGATPSMVSGAGLDDDLDMDRIEAFEKNLRIYALNGTAPRAPYVSANVNLWPETSVLLANPQLLSSLSQAQQRWLHVAAADAAANSTNLADTDSDLVTPLCRRGARFADATEAQLTDLRRAFAPVYARLQHDRQTSAFMADIEALKSTVHAQPLGIPQGCTGPAPTARTPLPGPAPDDASVLNGVYRVDLFYGALVVLGIGQADARAIAATHTLTLSNGRWSRRSDGPEESLGCSGSYVVAGGRIIFVADRLLGCERPGDGLTLMWTLRDSELALTDGRGIEANGIDGLILASRPWHRVGDPPAGTELRR
jgi:TRAP-type C4-dicarboxylate transport system substrate-binding protein